MSLRQFFRRLVPSWLRDEEQGAPILYSVGILADAVEEHARQGTELRFPDDAPDDALPYLARDRRIVRGIGESREAYNARLIAWLDDHRTRGNPFALMRQLRAYCNAAVRVRTVDRRGNWYTIDRDGSYSFAGPGFTQGVATTPWDWDGGGLERWARFWVIIYPTTDGQPWSEGPAWGDPGLVWGAPGLTWGSTATVDQVADVRRIVRDWKPAGTRCEHIIIAFDDASFAPDGSSGDHPSGDWQFAPNRLATARYWRGTRAMP